MNNYTNPKGCGNLHRNYESDEMGNAIPCELLICGKQGWLCNDCKITHKKGEENGQ